MLCKLLGLHSFMCLYHTSIQLFLKDLLYTFHSIVRAHATRSISVYLTNIRKLGLDMEEGHVLIEPRVPSRGAAVLLKALRESVTIGCPLKTV